jgi:hypothetical protein
MVSTAGHCTAHRFGSERRDYHPDSSMIWARWTALDGSVAGE